MMLLDQTARPAPSRSLLDQTSCTSRLIRRSELKDREVADGVTNSNVQYTDPSDARWFLRRCPQE